MFQVRPTNIVIIDSSDEEEETKLELEVKKIVNLTFTQRVVKGLYRKVGYKPNLCPDNILSDNIIYKRIINIDENLIVNKKDIIKKFKDKVCPDINKLREIRIGLNETEANNIKLIEAKYDKSLIKYQRNVDDFLESIQTTLYMSSLFMTLNEPNFFISIKVLLIISSFHRKSCKYHNKIINLKQKIIDIDTHVNKKNLLNKSNVNRIYAGVLARDSIKTILDTLNPSVKEQLSKEIFNIHRLEMLTESIYWMSKSMIGEEALILIKVFSLINMLLEHYHDNEKYTSLAIFLEAMSESETCSSAYIKLTKMESMFINYKYELEHDIKLDRRVMNTPSLDEQVLLNELINICVDVKT